jgi:hypothetical protein
MAAGGAAAGAAAIAQAIAASGVVVRLEPEEFSKILIRMKDPLVVTASGGWLRARYQYLVSYKGLAFHTGSKTPLTLPINCEVVTARKMWSPG